MYFLFEISSSLGSTRRSYGKLCTANEKQRCFFVGNKKC